MDLTWFSLLCLKLFDSLVHGSHIHGHSEVGTWKSLLQVSGDIYWASLIFSRAVLSCHTDFGIQMSSWASAFSQGPNEHVDTHKPGVFSWTAAPIQILEHGFIMGQSRVETF